MKHYICTGGCGAESEISEVCHAEGCDKKGQPLIPCLCTDNNHLNLTK